MDDVFEGDDYPSTGTDGVGPTRSRRTLIKPWDSTWSKPRILICKILMSEATECVLGFVILLNVFVIIEETNLRAADTEIYPWLKGVAYVMTCIYTVEVAVRLFVFRVDFWTNPWIDPPTRVLAYESVSPPNVRVTRSLVR